MYIHYTTGNEAYASDPLKGDIMRLKHVVQYCVKNNADDIILTTK